MNQSKELEIRTAISNMIEHIKITTKNNIVEQCSKDINRSEVEKLTRVVDASIAHAYVNSMELVLNVLKD